jgi:6-phosphofructokinase 2
MPISLRCRKISLPPANQSNQVKKWLSALPELYGQYARRTGWRPEWSLTSGAALAAAVEEGVDLIKPNLHEMRELSGVEPSDAREWEDAAKAIVRTKRIPVIALTMGHLGAVLITHDRILRAGPLAITPLSAVGAGDGFLAALVWQLALGADLAGCFRQAVAAGAAALLTPGTELCRPHDVKRLAAEVIIETT